MFMLDLGKAEEPEIKLLTSVGLQKKQENSRKISTSASLTVDYNKLWKILTEMGLPDHITCLLRNLYASQEATEPDMEQQTGSKLGQEYVKAVYYHLAYLTYRHDISGEMQKWMRYKLD